MQTWRTILHRNIYTVETRNKHVCGQNKSDSKSHAFSVCSQCEFI